MTDIKAPTAQRCLCGLHMALLNGETYFCANCDQLQPGESRGIPRKITSYDIRYALHWRARIKIGYGPLPPDINADVLREDTP